MIKGIDISQHQYTVNWDKVKKQNIDFCILREGYRNTIDKYFLQRVKEANIPIHGVYHFCYAINEKEVLQQAKTCISNIQKAGLDKNIIVFFDFEYDTVDKAKARGKVLTKKDCINFTKTFCNYIKSQGYKTGVYANLDYYYNMYDKETVYGYDGFWLAEYNGGKDPSLPCMYHQYGQEKIDGINDLTDVNYCFEANMVPEINIQEQDFFNFQPYYGLISNSGSDQNGRASGGRAGDQTGSEWKIRTWYNRPWDCVLRYPDRSVANLIAQLAIEAADNNLIGYDQGQRNTYWQHLKASNFRPSQITIACESDCSAGVIANTKAAGYLKNIDALKNIEATYTGNMKSSFKAAGFQVLTASKYLNSFDYLMPGDILLNQIHHTATNLGIGKNSGYFISESNSSASSVTVGKNITSTKTSEIQTMLNKIGNYGLAIDNDFGPATTKAVIDFQQKNGLEVDGIVGNNTLKKLKELSSGYNKTIKRTGVVTANSLYVRSGPGTQYEPIKTMPIIYKNYQIGICDEINTNEKWYYVKLNGNTYGFCSAKYIK